MKQYLTEKEAVLEELGTAPDHGLDSSEAEKRLELNGKNKLAEGKKTSLFKRLIAQIADRMVLILIGAAVVSAVTSAIQHEMPTDVFVILAVVVINTVLGVVQEQTEE